jgi:hypothetical protein
MRRNYRPFLQWSFGQLAENGQGAASLPAPQGNIIDAHIIDAP